MKRFLTVLFMITIAAVSQAQWVVESFDNAVGPVFLDPPELNVNFFTNGAGTIMNLANDPAHYEGTGSMRIDYSIEGSDSWGGYGSRTTYIPGQYDSLPYIDLSTGTELSLWYKVTTPVTMTLDGTFFMEFKIAELNELGERDLWLHHAAIDFADLSGGWVNVTMPLVDVGVGGNNTEGFIIQFQDGDGVLQLDHIIGFEAALFYLTAGGEHLLQLLRVQFY